MNTFASHPGQVTIFRLPLVLITRFRRGLEESRPLPELAGIPRHPVPSPETSHVLAVLSRGVKAERNVRS